MSQQLYTTKELLEMTPEEMAVAQANGYAKPLTAEDYRNPTHPTTPQEPYAVTAWGSQLYDFVVPSGQRCQMRKLRPEELVGTDILDKITRLPAFADEQIQKAEGQPPKPPTMPSKQDMQALLEVLDELIPLVVVQPKVLADPKPDATGEVAAKHPGTIYVSDIELDDRVAIMERAVQGVKKLDNFRADA